MKQLIITDKNYYFGLLGILGALIFYNIYASATTNNLLGILPIGIQIILLYLLFSKSQYTQKAIRIWALIVFIGGQSLRLIGISMQVLADYMESKEVVGEMLISNKVISALTFIIIGIIVLVMNKGFGELREVENSP